MEPVVAVVVAAGSGIRLGGGTPKALREIGGKALVAQAVTQLAAGGVTKAVIVHPSGLEPSFVDALADAEIPLTFTAGGDTRQESVAAGLAVLPPATRLVLIHDAARALVPPEVVARVISALNDGAVGAIPVIPVVDTVRQLNATSSSVIDRSTLRAVQTPQGFQARALREAHDRLRATGEVVTDDAVAVEALGYEIVLVAGSSEALKITDPLDLAIAAAIVKELP